MLSSSTTPLIVWVGAEDPEVKLLAAVHIIKPLLLRIYDRVCEGLDPLNIRIPTILVATYLPLNIKRLRGQRY